jgi:hypothetical protein
MADRRSLTEGIDATPEPKTTLAERQFVHGPKARPPTWAVDRRATAPVNGRLRADFVELLKKASLTRELEGIEPHTHRDILEQALEAWLRTNGYLA